MFSIPFVCVPWLSVQSVIWTFDITGLRPLVRFRAISTRACMLLYLFIGHRWMISMTLKWTFYGIYVATDWDSNTTTSSGLSWIYMTCYLPIFIKFSRLFWNLKKKWTQSLNQEPLHHTILYITNSVSLQHALSCLLQSGTDIICMHRLLIPNPLDAHAFGTRIISLLECLPDFHLLELECLLLIMCIDHPLAGIMLGEQA